MGRTVYCKIVICNADAVIDYVIAINMHITHKKHEQTAKHQKGGLNGFECTYKFHRDRDISSSRSRSLARLGGARGKPAAPDVAWRAPDTWTPHTSNTSSLQTSARQRPPVCLLENSTHPRTSRLRTPLLPPRDSNHTRRRRTRLGPAAWPDRAAPWNLPLWPLRQFCVGVCNRRRCWRVWSSSGSCRRSGDCRDIRGNGNARGPPCALTDPGRFYRSCGRRGVSAGHGTSPDRQDRWAPLGERWTGPRPWLRSCRWDPRESNKRRDQKYNKDWLKQENSLGQFQKEVLKTINFF